MGEQEAADKAEEALQNEPEIEEEPEDQELLQEMRNVLDKADAEEEAEQQQEEGGDDNNETEQENIQPSAEMFKAQLLNQIVDFYQKEHGRDPTEEEVVEGMKDVLRAMAAGQDGAEEEGDEEYQEEEGEEEEEEIVDEAVQNESTTGKRPLENAEEP